MKVIGSDDVPVSEKLEEYWKKSNYCTCNGV